MRELRNIKKNTSGKVVAFIHCQKIPFHVYTPVEAAKNIKTSVFSSVKIHTEDGRKDKQHHGKVEHHHHSSLQDTDRNKRCG